MEDELLNHHIEQGLKEVHILEAYIEGMWLSLKEDTGEKEIAHKMNKKIISIGYSFESIKLRLEQLSSQISNKKKKE